VLVSKARELGIKKVVEDSSGNAGSAISAYCAKAKSNVRSMFHGRPLQGNWSRSKPMELI
jgi:threonine synthase